MAMNTSQTPTARGVLCLNPKRVWCLSGKQNLWSGYLFAKIWISGLLWITITALLSTKPPV